MTPIRDVGPDEMRQNIGVGADVAVAGDPTQMAPEWMCSHEPCNC